MGALGRISFEPSGISAGGKKEVRGTLGNFFRARQLEGR